MTYYSSLSRPWDRTGHGSCPGSSNNLPEVHKSKTYNTHLRWVQLLKSSKELLKDSIYTYTWIVNPWVYNPFQCGWKIFCIKQVKTNFFLKWHIEIRVETGVGSLQWQSLHLNLKITQCIKKKKKMSINENGFLDISLFYISLLQVSG